MGDTQSLSKYDGEGAKVVPVLSSLHYRMVAGDAMITFIIWM